MLPSHPLAPLPPPRVRGSRRAGGGGGCGGAAAPAAAAGHAPAPRRVAPATVRFVMRTWLGAANGGGARAFLRSLEVDAHTENGHHGATAQQFRRAWRRVTRPPPSRAPSPAAAAH